MQRRRVAQQTERARALAAAGEQNKRHATRLSLRLFGAFETLKTLNIIRADEAFALAHGTRFDQDWIRPT